MNATLEERFWLRVAKSSVQDCWTWMGSKNGKGYGSFTMSRRTTPAYRLAYLLCVGEIPDGLEIDHLCGNRICVNPAHLEPVTHRENILRMHRRRSAYKCGHIKSADTTYTRPNGTNTCILCKHVNTRAYNKRTRLLAKGLSA